MNELWVLWLPIAFVAPCLWALVSVLDLYLVLGLYQDEWDGTLTSGAFQLFPWLLVALKLGLPHWAKLRFTNVVVYFSHKATEEVKEK